MGGDNAFLKTVASLLALLLLSGCATRKVDFTSIPPGAQVTVGKRTGITPCTLKVGEGVDRAIFTLSDGLTVEVPVHEGLLDSGLDDAEDGARKAFGATMMVVGGVTAVAGIGMLIVGGLAEWADGEEDVPDPQTSDAEELIGAGIIVTFVGGTTFALGHWIYPSREHPEIHADFGLPEGEVYEENEYGARRLKDYSD